MAKKASIKKTDLSREDLVKQAPRLALVLRALRKKNPAITSDTLWENMLQRWSGKDLEGALKQFESSRRVGGFKVLLQPLPQADESGFFTADGEKWGTIPGLSREMAIRKNTVRRHIETCRQCKGKTTGGNIVTFYSLSDTKKSCAIFKKILPTAGKDGFFVADGELWGTLYSICESLRIGRKPTKARVGKYRSRQGKDQFGRPNVFYALSDVKRACADLLEKIPQADKDGFFMANSKRWGTIPAISRKLGLSTPTIKKHLLSCSSRKGKDSRKARANFYPLSDVKKACKGLLKKAPIADRNGFFNADGEIWGTKLSLARRLRISRDSVNKRISSCRFRKGKRHCGDFATFYALSDVKRVCADLLAKKRAKRTKR